MTKMPLLSKVGCLVAAAAGLVAGCAVEPGQAIANGKRFNAFAEPAGVAARADLQVYRPADNT